MAEHKNEHESVSSSPAPADSCEEEKRTLEYWTEERMKGAKPLPLPSPDTESPAKDDSD